MNSACYTESTKTTASRDVQRTYPEGRDAFQPGFARCNKSKHVKKVFYKTAMNALDGSEN